MLLVIRLSTILKKIRVPGFTSGWVQLIPKAQKFGFGAQNACH